MCQVCVCYSNILMYESETIESRLSVILHFILWVSGADPGWGGQNYKGAPHKYGECSQKLYSVLF